MPVWVVMELLDNRALLLRADSAEVITVAAMVVRVVMVAMVVSVAMVVVDKMVPTAFLSL
jgi:hypothetical protein